MGSGKARYYPLSLSLAVAVSASLTIGLPLAGSRVAWLGYVFTPLTMVLILGLALSAPPSRPPRYRWGIVAGLVFSLAGDVLLMLPRDLFLAGLSSFLAAQVCYVVAFTSGSRFAAKPLSFVLLGGVGVALMIFLWAGIPTGLRLPVLVYAGILLAMAAQAASRALDHRTVFAGAAALGAILFVVSDSLLALNRFGHPVRASRLLVLAPYFAAQWLIAISVAAPRIVRTPI